MVDFSDEQTKKYIDSGKKLALMRNFAIALFLCLAVVAACFVAAGESQLTSAMVTLIFCGVVAACIICLVALSVACSAKLKEQVCKQIAAHTQNSNLLSGDDEIALVATYSGGKMTISKQNSLKEVCFDLSALKKSVAIYSNFGVLFNDYLVAFIAKNKGDYKSVTITDDVGKQSEVLTILANGELACDTKNNYFMKKGLL